jgi:hypothetical protein
MATSLQSQIQLWDRNFLAEYVRATAYSPFMGRADGAGAMMPIVARFDLVEGGKSVNVPLIVEAEGGGVQGSTRLAGNEEELSTFNQSITVNYNRHAFVIKKPDPTWTGLDLRKAAKANLKTWARKGLRDDITVALMAFDGESYLMGKLANSPSLPPRTPLQAYNAVSEATKDAWLAANADRYLFGAAVSNASTNDHSAALANIDTTNDRMSTDIVSLAKSVAKTSDRLITPFMSDADAGRDHFVLFVGPKAFRDLKLDDTMQLANRDARTRGTDNPIFQDGDLLWDGVIIREIPEIPTLAGVGNGGTDVEPAFLCGAQAVSVAWGQEPESRTKKEDDYGFETGVGIEESRGVAKNVFGGKQHGLVNIYVSAPPTA